MPVSDAACQTCKIRRIKVSICSRFIAGMVFDSPLQCDENKPICKKCAKSRRICLGTDAAKRACFTICVENSFASGKDKRPRGPRSSLTILRPNFDLQTRALAYYLKYHLRTLREVPDISGGLSECVSAWELSGRTSPMVDLALSSMALAVYSRTQHHPPAAIEAASRYQRLLRIAQKQISDIQIPVVTESTIDACLLSAFLMGRYEGIYRTPQDFAMKDSVALLQTWSHYDGIMAILKVWNDQLSQNPATFIIKHTRRQIIRLSLVRRIPLPKWILDGQRFGEHQLELDYDRIIVRVVNLCYSLKSLQQKNGPHDRTAQQLNLEARQLDNALQDWVAHVPSIHVHHQHVLTKADLCPYSSKDIFSQVLYSYSKPDYAAIWVDLFATRLLINNTRLQILEGDQIAASVDSTHEEERLDCISTIKIMADSLASSIPFCLGRFEAKCPESSNEKVSVTISTNEEIKPYLVNWIGWPLTIASSLNSIDIEQQLWFRSELARLGRKIGDGVLACAETQQLVPL